MKILILNFICLVVQARCPDPIMTSGNSAAACLIRPMILSMITAKIAVGRREGPMNPIALEPRVLALLSGRTQRDIKVTKVVGKRTGRNRKTPPLPKKSAAGREVHQKILSREVNARSLLLNGLGQIKKLLNPPHTGTLN